MACYILITTGVSLPVFVRSEMSPQIPGLNEAFTTQWTLVWVVFGVGHLVIVKGTVIWKAATTVVALMWLETCVTTSMDFKLSMVVKVFIT